MEEEYAKNKFKMVVEVGVGGEDRGRSGDGTAPPHPSPTLIPIHIILHNHRPISNHSLVGDEVDAYAACHTTIDYNIVHHAQCSNVFSLHVPVAHISLITCHATVSNDRAYNDITDDNLQYPSYNR